MGDRNTVIEEDGDLVPNGVLADTGRLLPGVDESAGARLRATAGVLKAEAEAARRRAVDDEAGLLRYGVSMELDPEDLSQTGWGIIFPAGMDTAELEEALAPLIEWRRAEAACLFKIFKGEDGYRNGEGAMEWLARHRVGLDLVDPCAGIPFYLTIVGSPEAVPMSFQYLLDTFWAVGRLHFDTLEAYAAYARSVVRYETAERPPQLRKQAAIFATEHPFDSATRMFTRDVARAFLKGANGRPLGQRQRFHLDPLLGADATKDNLGRLLRGERPGGVPALLFSGTHGMAFSMEDTRQVACQGALVCQDWEGFGAITEDDWFSACDLPSDAKIHGMIHFLFACYGGGWEKIDTFRDDPSGRARQVAERPGVARLPQALLAHPNGGALAAIAHVDRAWSFTFKTPSGHTQTTGMREVLVRILMGQRVGNATDIFNMKWSVLCAPLADALRNFEAKKLTGKELARLWIARDDARNYIVLGDPAVRLRVKDMVDAAPNDNQNRA